jgi:hypothetical protein
LIEVSRRVATSDAEEGSASGDRNAEIARCGCD